MTLPSGTVIFLFTDIEGSTKLAQEHPDKWESLRARHHAILKSAIKSNNGYVFQIIGDAFCASFHTAGDAVRAAARAQTDFYKEDWGETPVKIRIGINTGAAQASVDIDHSGGYKGYTAMARVQRIMSAGHGGQVLISSATQELLLEDMPEDVSLRDLGEKRLKDLNRPEHIYQLVIADLPVEFPALKTLDAYRHNLPVQLTSFIGREKEMAEIKGSIATHRLITLTGTGGTGKTRLALQVAADVLDEFSDGVWLVELAEITDSALIPQTILAAIGIPEQAGMTDLQLLRDYLRKKNILLVLDNCEHVIEDSAKLVRDLVSHALELKVLTTSREALGLQGELIWQVPSLSLPDVEGLPAIEELSQYEAVRLFIERAALVQPQFLVTNENAPAVAQICFRLDGIPLAIELAAARIRAMSVDQIFKRLDNRFRLLTGGKRTALERHQTLRATIAWSYNLLSGDEKFLLCRLSIFVGGWSLEAAEQVCVEGGDGFDVLDLLTRLVEKSLVNLDGSRYRMLETTRQFAREKLIDSDEGATMHENHLIYFLNLAEQGDRQIHGPDQVVWMDRLERESDNFRAALDWCVSEQNTESALYLLAALSTAWDYRGYFYEIEGWFDKIRVLPEVNGYPAPYAKVLNIIGRHQSLVGEFRLAQSISKDSQEIWLKLGAEGERGLAENLDCQGSIALYDEKNIETAKALFGQSFKLYQKHGDEWGMAWLIFRFGSVAFVQGLYAEAEDAYLKSLTKFRELGDKSMAANVLAGLGEMARFLDDYERAGKFWEQNLDIFREARRRFALAYPFHGLAWVSLRKCDYDKARTLFEESLTLSIESGNKSVIAICLAGLAGILGETGKPEQAARLFGAVEFLLKDISRLEPQDQKDFDHYVTVVREQLDEAAIENAWAEGRTMMMEQAIKYALEEIDE
jgi:predicted ATPase/class 3 adenylate cyclase